MVHRHGEMRQMSCIISLLIVVIGVSEYIALASCELARGTKTHVSATSHNREDGNDVLESLLTEINSDLNEIRTELQLQKETMKIQREMVDNSADRLSEHHRHIVTLRDNQEVFREEISNMTDKLSWLNSNLNTFETTCRRKELASAHRVDAQTLSRGGYITGLAVMNNELYVGRMIQSTIEVFDVVMMSNQRNLSIPGLSCPIDLASCTQCNVVYISDQCSDKIYAINEDGIVVSSWLLMGKPAGISVNSQLNVIVTMILSQTLHVFTPGGELMRSITLQSDIKLPKHAVELDDSRYVVVHGDYPRGLNRVCIVDNQGTIIQSYGGDYSSGQLQVPQHILVLGGSLIITDQNNSRLLLLDLSSLTHVRELISTSLPFRMAISADNNRLFVSDPHQLNVFNLIWA